MTLHDRNVAEEWVFFEGEAEGEAEREASRLAAVAEEAELAFLVCFGLCAALARLRYE